VRLSQDSVDEVITVTSPVAMETVPEGAGRVFRLWAGAVALAMYARPGAGLYCSFWTTGPITAVAAGRLQMQNRGRLHE